MDSEFRYNPVNGDWVIISPKRAKRPHSLREKKIIIETSDPKVCPFCGENIRKSC